MKNNVENLLELIVELKLLLELKEKSLFDANLFNAHSQGQVNNIKRRILALESDFKEIKERYFDKPEVFINFRKRVK